MTMNSKGEESLASLSRKLIPEPPPIGSGVAFDQAAFCSIYTSPATEIVELSIEDVNTRAFAGTFAWCKKHIASIAYGLYHVVNAKLEIVSIKRDEGWGYVVYRDSRGIGEIDYLYTNSGCNIKIMDSWEDVLAQSSFYRSHRSRMLEIDVQNASHQFAVASNSSFLDFLWCFSNLLLFWCKGWRRLRPSKDMVLPSSIFEHQLRDDDMWLMFACSLLIRSDWFKYVSDIDIGE